jgi:hypothetical protein
MVVKRIGPLSLAKISGVLYALVGLIVGFFFAALSLLGMAANQDAGGAVFGAFFGVGAIVLLPIFYGLLGFVACLVMAALYNLIAGWVGGVEVQLDPPRAPGV